MITCLLIAIVALYIGLKLYGAYWNHQLAISKRKEHAILMKIERNKQVLLFRTRMIYSFDAGITKRMAGYREMLDSDKELIGGEWINVDELINLN